MSRLVQSQALILRRTPFRETSLVVEGFCGEVGRISIMARGVRGEKSRVAGLLEPFNEVDVVLGHSSTSDWYMLREVSLIRNHLLDKDYNNGILIQAAAEILLQLDVPPDEAAEIFGLFKRFSDYIGSTKPRAILYFWRFLNSLLRMIGVAPELRQCVVCERIDEAKIVYRPEKGGLQCICCHTPADMILALPLKPEVIDILSHLHEIGNHADRVTLNQDIISQINQVFLIHLGNVFHGDFHLRSLEYYEGE